MIRYFDCYMTMRHSACPLVRECRGGCGYKQARKIIESMRDSETKEQNKR